MKRNVHLLTIDPQFDFCDPTGKLFVPGADADMVRLAGFVDAHRNEISNIHVTLDSHHLLHVAHPIWWSDKNGNHPGIFTLISASDLKNGTWTTTHPGLYRESATYVEALDASKRYPLTIWPPHCLIGSIGATIYDPYLNAIDAWSAGRFHIIDFVAKGSNPRREHYSAVKAEVPDPTDPGTLINTNLVRMLEEADEILISGEALSHCVANTVMDIADAFTDRSYISKFTLLRDCTSLVPDPPNMTIFTDFTDKFLSDMQSNGMRVTTSTEWNN